MGAKKKDPFVLRKSRDDFLIKPLGTALMMTIGVATAFLTGGVPFAIAASALSLFQTWRTLKSDIPALVTKQVSGVPLPENHPASRMVRRLAKQAGLKNVPHCITSLKMRYDPALKNTIFAATTGTPRSSVIILSPDIEKKTTASELNAILAHEITHIKNSDMTGGVVQSNFAKMALFSLLYAGASLALSVFGLSPIPPIATTIMPFAGLLSALVVQASISRAKERRADRGSAAMTRNPWALASALGRIVELQLNTLKTNKKKEPGNFMNLMVRIFRSHPKTKDRRHALMGMGKTLIKGDFRRAHIEKYTLAEIKDFDKGKKRYPVNNKSRTPPPDSFGVSGRFDNICASAPVWEQSGFKKVMDFNEVAKEQDNNTLPVKTEPKIRPLRFNNS